jgi:hypothetical protein
MDKTLKQQKIELWHKKLSDYEKQLEETMQRRGEAAREGDLRENAAYQMASEDADMLRAQIENVKKILRDLGADPDKEDK